MGVTLIKKKIIKLYIYYLLLKINQHFLNKKFDNDAPVLASYDRSISIIIKNFPREQF